MYELIKKYINDDGKRKTLNEIIDKFGSKITISCRQEEKKSIMGII